MLFTMAFALTSPWGTLSSEEKISRALHVPALWSRFSISPSFMCYRQGGSFASLKTRVPVQVEVAPRVGTWVTPRGRGRWAQRDGHSEQCIYDVGI
ncbi:hypothetical protein HOY82DRAFT_569428, partial [Tuber indicum]